MRFEVMTDGSESDGGNAIESASATITSNISKGQLFGPFSNPLHWLSFKCCDNTCANNNNPSNELFSKVDIARHSGEQNIKVIHKNGNFYFKAIRSLNLETNCENDKKSDKNSDKNSETPKLYAWFSHDIESRLPIAPSSSINGSTRYFCPLCNEVFMYSNSVVSHMLCSCPKRIQMDSIPPPSNVNTSPNSSAAHKTPTFGKESTQEGKHHVSKKRGFDIESLVRDESNESISQKRNKNHSESNKSEERHSFSNFSAFHRPKSPFIPKSNSLPTSSAPLLTSAFKKVDQKLSSFNNPYDFSSIYQRVATSSMLPSTPHSVSHPMLPQMPMTSSLPTSLSSTNTKPLVSNTLLPYLPPSLAALTFPTSNWCAKCNATFRMTSDLVYHMRSHHKTTLGVDPMKKKREEKLRCNICNETFRERHHLTRHMTSHQ